MWTRKDCLFYFPASVLCVFNYKKNKIKTSGVSFKMAGGVQYGGHQMIVFEIFSIIQIHLGLHDQSTFQNIKQSTPPSEHTPTLLSLTWFLADPAMTTAGRTDRGGTGNTVINIQSGRANLGLSPSTIISSSVIKTTMIRGYSAFQLNHDELIRTFPPTPPFLNLQNSRHEIQTRSYPMITDCNHFTSP